MLLRAASIVVQEQPEYYTQNGGFVRLFVIADNEQGIEYFAKGENGRIINLNGYAFSAQFKEICKELGVKCTY